MKKYIFYTSDGFTQDSSGTELDNCQILGWGIGLDAASAFRVLQHEASIETSELDTVWAEEVVGEAMTL